MRPNSGVGLHTGMAAAERFSGPAFGLGTIRVECRVMELRVFEKRGGARVRRLNFRAALESEELVLKEIGGGADIVWHDLIVGSHAVDLHG